MLPPPEGFDRKPAICDVEGSVTDHCGYASSPSPTIWRLCGSNDRYMDFSRDSLKRNAEPFREEWLGVSVVPLPMDWCYTSVRTIA
jgi:hypothetical protein